MFSYLRLLPPPWTAAEHLYKQWLNASYMWLGSHRRTSFLLRSPLRHSWGCTLSQTLGDDFCASCPSRLLWECPERVPSFELVNIRATPMHVPSPLAVRALPPCAANHCRQYLFDAQNLKTLTGIQKLRENKNKKTAQARKERGPPRQE